MPPADLRVPRFRGEIVAPGHPEFDALRRVWHGGVDRRPLAIARCRSAADVSAALRLARERGLPVAVRAGGHSLAGFSAIDDGLLIDLRPMRGVLVDPAARRARVSAGLTWAELDAATQAHGLAVTGGRISDTGVAGLTLGSGSGWLERLHGLTADSLLAATVVTASGDVVRASEHEQPDLFWALHGGGGNFGIVTEFEFALHPVGPTVLGGPLVFPFERGADVLAAYRDVMESAPDELGGCAVLHLAPPAPFVCDQLVGRPVLTLSLAVFGTPERNAELAAPLRALGPVADAAVEMPYAALQRSIDAGSPAGMLGRFESSFLDALPDAAIAAALGACREIPSPFTEVLIQPLGGEYARVPAERTALAHRDAPWMYHALAQWPSDAETPLNSAWTRTLVDALAPWSRGASHPNHVSSDRQERVRSFYGEQTYGRLVKVKARWDPENVFRHNQNIRPSTGAAVTR